MNYFPKEIVFGLFSSFLLFACSPSSEKSIAQEEERPNIILISADDLGWSDLGCYGSEVHTPHLDSLAQNGMRFTSFYNTSKCFPSRASLLTGVYAQDCGYSKTHTNKISNAVTLGEVLQEAGYRTYWSGKHHGKENPYERGFHHYYGLKDGACNHFNPGLQREGEPAPAQKRNDRAWCIDSAMYQPYTPEAQDFYTTDYFTNYALTYLDEAKDQQQPFFLYLAYTAPHDPLMAWPEDIKKYEGKYDEGYEAIRKKRYQKQQELGLISDRHTLSQPSFDAWSSLSEEEKKEESRKMEVYAAMIDRMDQNIGRLLSRLRAHELDKNTIIFFVSDNGASAEVVNLQSDDDEAEIGTMARWVSLGENWANVSNTPFRYYKNYSYEGGINTPFIAYWPEQIESGSFSDQPGHLVDFMATLVDVAQAEYPASYQGEQITPMRGQSLLPALAGQTIERKAPIYWQWSRGRAMRWNEWKLVKQGLDREWDLYHIENDPTETNNMAETYPEIVHELDSMYQQWWSQYEELAQASK
ncbi:arylsulfatase [Porifericola rhodea]|uniref:arylsulfatase n=1 Tax=Porifericola rhodea TaxID=930972 RepID=UPI002664E790|nr:arylsulfatase [Porifericola rhodea]WKN31842.1 arylsulfatase [Porifericola rhodea]